MSLRNQKIQGIQQSQRQLRGEKPKRIVIPLVERERVLRLRPTPKKQRVRMMAEAQNLAKGYGRRVEKVFAPRPRRKMKKERKFSGGW